MNTPRTISRWLALPIMLSAVIPIGLPAYAQSDEDRSLPQREDVAEQEGAVYGRLRFVEGAVSLTRSSQITTDLVINDPLAPGDLFSTVGGGRAEIQLADGSNVKFDYDTELVLMSLSDSSNQIENTTILQLGRGSIIVRAENMDSTEKRFQIDTDGASIFLLSDGLFRIDIRPDGTVGVSSRRGVAEVMSQEVSSLVRSGERISVRPDQIPGEARVFNTRSIDEFDGWAADRDESLVRRARVDEETPAGLPEPVEPYTEELSYYGRWHNNPSYGWVWRPVGLSPDWQPYLYGRWVDCPSGLVWVSYEPWGWAPFHYGRWDFLMGSGWVWIPGHVFSGAYVAWSVAPGYFGWCPLGYYDRPVSFSLNFGFHRNPWIYINAHNIYSRRVNTCVIRDAHVVRDIERKRVIIRGRPVIDPRRVKDAPRLANELHNVAQNRRDLRLDDEPGKRLPFRENERQKQVALNNRRLREGNVSRGTPVGRGGSGRPVSVMPTDRRVNVPSTRRGVLTSPERTAAPKTDAPGRTKVTGDARRSVAPRSNQQPRGNSLPERVIPRIIPRPGAASTNAPGKRPAQNQPRGNVRKQETPVGTTAAPRKSGPPPRSGRQVPNARPSQERPRGGGAAARPQQQAPRQQQQQRQERSKPSGGDKGGDRKHNKG